MQAQINKAKATRDKLNDRMRELEAIATGNYEEDYESF